MQERAHQFKVGDKAVYPAQGVAEVIKIEEKDIAGSRQSFYVLRILDTDRKIMVPVSNASAVGLRQVISEQEIREIFDILRERTITFDNQTWNRRYRGFMDKIKTGSIYDVAEVLRDLYRLKTDKQLSFGERRMLETARGLIVKEIAISRGQTEEQVRTEIEAIFLANLELPVALARLAPRFRPQPEGPGPAVKRRQPGPLLFACFLVAPFVRMYTTSVDADCTGCACAAAACAPPPEQLIPRLFALGFRCGGGASGPRAPCRRAGVGFCAWECRLRCSPLPWGERGRG
jgi:CarD family transcriptional regulator